MTSISGTPSSLPTNGTLDNQPSLPPPLKDASDLLPLYVWQKIFHYIPEHRDSLSAVGNLFAQALLESDLEIAREISSLPCIQKLRSDEVLALPSPISTVDDARVLLHLVSFYVWNRKDPASVLQTEKYGKNVEGIVYNPPLLEDFLTHVRTVRPPEAPRKKAQLYDVPHVHVPRKRGKYLGPFLHDFLLMKPPTESHSQSRNSQP